MHLGPLNFGDHAYNAMIYLGIGVINIINLVASLFTKSAAEWICTEPLRNDLWEERGVIFTLTVKKGSDVSQLADTFNLL